MNNKRLFGLIMLLIIGMITGCGKEKKNDVGILNEKTERSIQKYDTKTEYSAEILSDYSEWFNNEQFIFYDDNMSIPEELLNKVSASCLFYDIIPRSKNLMGTPSVITFGYSIYNSYNIIEFDTLFNREDAWKDAYTFIMNNAKDARFDDIYKEWCDNNNISIDDSVNYIETQMFYIAQYILSKDQSFYSMTDTEKTDVINKINDIYDSNPDIFSLKKYEISFFSIIIEEKNDLWIDYINNNGLLDAGWENDFNVWNGKQDYRKENNYWKELR